MKKLGNSAFPDASHRMNLPPCNGIKRAESTDLTNRAVAGAGAAISSVADWIGEIKKGLVYSLRTFFVRVRGEPTLLASHAATDSSKKVASRETIG